MPIITPIRCWRGRDDCEPLHSIEGVNPDITPEDFEAPDFRPDSFVCCGINHSESRLVAQDCYRLCFKNAVADEVSDNDVQDLTHLLAVISQALAIGASRAVNSGSVTVPTMQAIPPAEEMADE